ncbi:hypothetical protein P8C59_000082 [Phyllachora maydis]|nr:hypothetical protein P8C59_000082 [Phyllachora maydis]
MLPTTVLDTSTDLASLFQRQAQATPDAVALEDAHVTLTYGEVDHATSALAARLQALGVGRDGLVGVLMERSSDYVIACLAALRAGGAFLVLEMAYPHTLLGGVLADAQPRVVLTHQLLASRIREVDEKIPLILLDAGDAEDTPCELHRCNRTQPAGQDHRDLDRLAFVSYSSGTTGKPKGIANSHGAAVRSYGLRFRLSDVGPGDKVACNVFFVWEMIRPLLRGAAVFCVPDEASYDPVSLVAVLSERRVTETLMTPTLLAAVLARHPGDTVLKEKLRDLKTLWLNGEVVTVDLAKRAIRAFPEYTRLLNCYSVSETHEIACGDIKAMLHQIPAEAIVCPVGRPLLPECTYLLDEHNLQPVEAGQSGELFIGGGLLARGYLSLPEQTAKVFLPDPFNASAGAKMYRTGDRARLLPSGLLEITGRVGSMIKLRGYTIQPGAVESAIVKHLAVRNCAVVVHGEGLERQLVAYVVPDSEDTDSQGRGGGRTRMVVDEHGYSPTARRVLAAHLAHYMIPPVWVELDELPTHTVSGKADLKRLHPPPRPRSSSISKRSSHGATLGQFGLNTGTIARVWAAALGIDPASVTEEHSFFDLGGHS